MLKVSLSIWLFFVGKSWKGLTPCQVFFWVGLTPCQLFAYPTPVDFSGKLMVWEDVNNENPLVFEVYAESEYDYNRAMTYARSAASLWSSVPNSRLRMASKEETSDRDIQISIEISDDFSEAPDAGAYSYFDETDDGKAIHCKIKMRQQYLEYSMTFSKTILHEFGHCLGLGHSLIPESIMSYQLDKNSFALDVDDQAAISRMYPSDHKAPSLPPGCVARTRSSSSTPASVDGLWILFFGIILKKCFESFHLKKKAR